jgi:plastocyanin
VGVLAAVASVVGAAPALGATVTVHVGQGGLQFVQSSVTINQGDTVHWVWDGNNHSVTSGPVATAPAGDGKFPDTGIQFVGHTSDQIFSSAGSYPYFCSVHFGRGMTGTVTVLAPDTAPTASFTTSPPGAVAGQAVSFDGSTSSDTDGDTVASYTWHFDDGTADQTTTTPTIPHSYIAAGTYNATLTVTDARGTASTTTSHAITVAAPPPDPLVAGSVPPKPAPEITAFTVSPTHICTRRGPKCRHPGLHVRFKLAGKARLRLTVTRRSGKAVGSPVKASGNAGGNDIVFTGAGLKPGNYVLTLTATSSSGKQSKKQGQFSVT